MVLIQIRARELTGIFYAAPAPESPPFVEVGKEILPGDTLCIIEAMKFMNPLVWGAELHGIADVVRAKGGGAFLLAASTRAVVRAIRVQDKGEVRAGMPLFDLEVEGAELSGFPAEEEPAPSVTATEEVPKAETENAEIPVTSTHVGWFYSVSSKSTKPYVQIGERVLKGQVLCSVNALGFDNEILSPAKGVVKKRCPDEGAPVEYGQVLFILESAD